MPCSKTCLLIAGALLATSCETAPTAGDARADQKLAADALREARGSDATGPLCGSSVCGAEQICCGPAACGHCVPKNSGVYCPPTCPDARAQDSAPKLDTKQPAPDAKAPAAEAGKPDAKKPVLDGAPQTACGPSLSCPSVTQICVINEAWTKTYACKPVPAGCEAARTCACAGTALCIGAFNLCADAPSGTSNTITCSCPSC